MVAAARARGGSSRRLGLLALLLAAAPSAAAGGAGEEGSCPAGGGPGCGEVALDPSLQKCVKWRQTGGCDPHGPREQRGDKGCNEEIPTGSSGYCQCGVGEGSRQRAREVTCDHRPFKCATECLQVARYTCVSWRQTAGCSADGQREKQHDKACDVRVDSGSSGYCECGGGRIIRKPGCQHAGYTQHFTCSEECLREPDLYEELGLDLSASEKEIKQAFRKVSLKYHPDKTQGDVAMTARFVAIREAYDIVGDAEQRALYDSAGLRMVNEAKNKQVQKGPAMHGEVHVSLEGMYNGEEIRTNVQRKIICRGCAEQMTERCRACTAGCANEIELRNVQMGPMIMQQQVEVASKQRCKLQMTELVVDVEPGMSDGDSITFKAMGEHQPKKMPGDVVLKLKERKHKVFSRRGNDLHTEIDISLKESLLGFERTLIHLDKRRVVLGYDRITHPFGVMKIEGEGMPHKGDPTQRGNLFVKCRIVMPQDGQLAESQRAWLRQNFPG